MKLTDLELNVDAVDNGAWVTDIPDMEGVSFCVRGSEYAPYQKALRSAMVVQGRRQRLQQQVDMEKFSATQNRLAAEHLLLGWSGLEDADGGDLAFSLPIALRLMTERKYRPVQRGVSYAIEIVDAGLAEHREEAEGN